ncbi:oxidoreductase [Roseateles noduli]|nr:oxidoreductase [Roseateles noduli]
MTPTPFAHQHPLPSGFGSTTSATDVLRDVDLTGKRVVVTGGYAGLGLETVRGLTAAGAHVVVPARSPDKARTALEGLSNVEQAAMDLLDPASIARFADELVSRGDPLDLLILNAGIMAAPLRRDARGHESQFAANHLGHFELALRLWPALLRAGAARVVVLTSLGHRFAPVDFDDPDFAQRPYDKWKAYGQSKSANALFAVGLDRRGAAHNVRGFAVHPGSILTDLTRDLTAEDYAAFGLSPDAARGVAPKGLSVEEGGRYKNLAQGAATTLWCATSRQLDGLGGLYCENCDVARVVAEGESFDGGVRPWAIDPAQADRLWTLSERLTGVSLKP